MNDKEKLKSYINRSFGIIADSNTYVWVRAVNPQILGDIPDLGGGNFLMALGLFAVINYLGKIYALLKEDIAVKEKEVSDAKQWLKTNKATITDFEKAIEVKRVGQINELDAFKKLLTDCEGLNFGLNAEKLIEVWHNLRNKLTHVASPGKNYQMDTRLGGSTFEKAKEDAFNFNRVFFTDGSGVMHCNVDVLVIKVEKIKEWLNEKLEANAFQEKDIARALAWAEENE